MLIGVPCTKAGDESLQDLCGGFDSHVLHKNRSAGVKRYFDGKTAGHRFESCLLHKEQVHVEVAQLVEQQ
jgi:hypothetical protein